MVSMIRECSEKKISKEEIVSALPAEYREDKDIVRGLVEFCVAGGDAVSIARTPELYEMIPASQSTVI